MIAEVSRRAEVIFEYFRNLHQIVLMSRDRRIVICNTVIQIVEVIEDIALGVIVINVLGVPVIASGTYYGKKISGHRIHFFLAECH